MLTVIQMGSASVARLELAIELGPLDCGDPLDLCVEAAAFGRRKVLERAVTEGVRCSTYDSDEARVPLVRSTEVLRGAAYGGQLGTMQWLASCGSRPDGGVMVAAASARSREAVVWLREQGCEWDKMDHADGAVEVGSAIDGSVEGYCFCGPWSGRERPADLSFVRWLRELGAPWSSHTLSRLIDCAHADMRGLHWAVADDCPLSDGAGLSAALTSSRGWTRSMRCHGARSSRRPRRPAATWRRSLGSGAMAAAGEVGRSQRPRAATTCTWCSGPWQTDARGAPPWWRTRRSARGITRAILRSLEHHAWLRSQVDWSEAQWEPHPKRKQMMYDVYYQMRNYTQLLLRFGSLATWARGSRRPRNASSRLAQQRLSG